MRYYVMYKSPVFINKYHFSAHPQLIIDHLRAVKIFAYLLNVSKYAATV